MKSCFKVATDSHTPHGTCSVLPIDASTPELSFPDNYVEFVNSTYKLRDEMNDLTNIGKDYVDTLHKEKLINDFYKETFNQDINNASSFPRSNLTRNLSRLEKGYEDWYRYIAKYSGIKYNQSGKKLQVVKTFLKNKKALSKSTGPLNRSRYIMLSSQIIRVIDWHKAHVNKAKKLNLHR